MKKILFADSYNFKEKNFPNLISHLSKYDVEISFDQNYEDIKKQSGLIIDFDTFVFENIKINNELDDSELDFLIRDEVLYMISSEDDFLENDVSLDLDIYNFKYSNIVDIAKKRAIFWNSYWFENINTDICVVFGGNTIYTKALMKICKDKNIPCYVVEHSFTGNDYYFLMQYKALPNNVDVNCTSEKVDSNWVFRYKQKNNKNVKSVGLISKIKFCDYILILCQVRNDFSIISGKNRYINSAKFYKELINKLLETTQDNIVVKCHPYEDRKLNGILTYDYLSGCILELPQEYQSRVFLLKEFDLETLIFDSKFAITLTSQSGLEVLASNKPLITFGDAFYSKKGFTYDLNSIEDINYNYLKTIPNYLDIDKYNIFYGFMSNYFDLLISSAYLDKLSKELDLKLIDIKGSKSLSFKKSVINKKLSNNQDLGKNKSDKISIFEKDRILRLSRKFRKDPKLFFLDSKQPLLRKISNLFD